MFTVEAARDRRLEQTRQDKLDAMEGQTPRGVLYPAQNAAHTAVDTFTPNRPFARYVELYWHVRWHLPPDQPFKTKVLSHPNLHLVFEEPAPLLYGVQRTLFTRELHDEGQVLGVKFLPGGFRAMSHISASKLTDQRIPAAEIFGEEIAQLSSRIVTTSDGGTAVQLVEDLLAARLPETVDPIQQKVAAIVARITTTPSIVRVEQVAAESNMSVRTLQRVFAEYVGVSPKWVLRRARLQEVATRTAKGVAINWPELATDLGYADQAHLSRDFTAAVGTPPTRYAADIFNV